MQYIRLNNHVKMPAIGIGTYPLNGWPLLKTVWRAYRSGCRSFDTSAAYFNEQWLGYALRLLRLFGAKDLFVTTKLNNTGQRSGDVRAAFMKSMKKLGVEQIDLYMMHWPYPGKYLDSWKQMEALYKEGLVKAIGVCNFHQHHLEELLEIAEVVPAINQIELHPLMSQQPLREYCEARGIRVQAYTPVARMDPKLIENPVLAALAEKHRKSVPQIILRWDIQKGIVPIPKSANKARIKENLDIFDFEMTPEEIVQIDGINEDYRVRFDPDTVDYINVLKA